jgi:hypothetical protein
MVAESANADAAGLFAATRPGQNARPARYHEAVLAQICDFNPVPAFTTSSTAIIPSTVPIAHEFMPKYFRNQLAKISCFRSHGDFR